MNSKKTNDHMKKKTLVLNMDYSFHDIIPATRGFVLGLQNKVHVVHEYSNVFFRSANKEQYKIPSVIRLFKYVKRKRKIMRLTRSNIYKRDGYECVYCGSTQNLTLDHVYPKSKGGKDTWNNLVTACHVCNSEKSDKVIDKSKLNICRPTYFYAIHNTDMNIENDWKPYVFV